MTAHIRAAAEATFAEEGLQPHTWSNEPGYAYGAHEHDYHKVLFCVEGSIVFHTAEGDFDLGAGDRLDIFPSLKIPG